MRKNIPMGTHDTPNGSAVAVDPVPLSFPNPDEPHKDALQPDVQGNVYLAEEYGISPAERSRMTTLFEIPPGRDVEDFVHELHRENLALTLANSRLRLKNAEFSAVVQALRRAEARYRNLFDNATEGIVQWTPDRRLLTANAAFASMLGFSALARLREAQERDGGFSFYANEAAGALVTEELESKGTLVGFEFQLRHKETLPFWGCMNARRVPAADGQTSYYEAFVENITERKKSEEKLQYLAFHDPLTGLANRALFQDRLQMGLRRATRQMGYSFAVLYLDLDRFKSVNDCYGYNLGDEVLCQTAKTLRACVRDVDTVARFGGDEFAVLIEDASHTSVVVAVARRIDAALQAPFSLKGQRVYIGVSMGIVLRAERYTNPADILRDADIAMYRAKADSNSRFRFFNQRMRLEALASISMEADLRIGERNGEFFFEYQPLVSLTEESVYGFEALLRWRRKGILVSPAVFIPVAEDTGLIKSIGLHILEMACNQVAQWRHSHRISPIVHVNISGRQLEEPGFPAEVQGIFERTGVDPRFLRFEITESVLLDNTGACMQGIAQLRALGVRFCLDDFGTGFSSLSYLRRLPVDCIKLDRSFVTDIETDPKALAIVRNLVRLGHELGFTVVVEGIERAPQAELLKSVGCGLAQGFHYYRPLAVPSAEQLLF